MKLPEFSVNRKVSASMMAMILVVVGLISFSRLGLDFFPDIEFPTISIITTYSGASSEDIETMITEPLEEIISSVNRVKKVTSQTSEGVSVIMAEFEWGANLDFAAQDCRDQIGLYANYLPEGAENPLVFKFNISQIPVVFYGITADMPNSQLKKYIEDEVAPRLERIDGVASARVFSTDTREILVDVDKSALESRNLTLNQVMMALGMENLNQPAGNLVERHTDFLVRTVGEFESLDDIRRVIVGATQKGDVIYLQDVADVKDTIRESRALARVQRKNGVYLMLSKRSGSNTAIVGVAAKKELARIREGLPQGIGFHMIMDQSDMVQKVVKRVSRSAWQGGVLAVLLIFLFLRNWRPTLIIGLAIPLSVITTFIAFYAAGYTLNLLTLGGLALGVGMLVDNAIVVIENTFRHIEEGKAHEEGSIAGASEVGMAITASTLTTIVVFLPLVFASGITGKLTKGLALAVAFSLVSSLFIALTVVPLLSSLLFKPRKKAKATAKARKDPQFMKAKAFYRRALEAALSRRGLVLGAVIGLFVLSLAIIPFMGTEFMPQQDQNMIILRVKMPVGTSLDETNRVVSMVEQIMSEIPEITIISAQAGSRSEEDPGDSASGFGLTGTHEGLIWVGLKDVSERKKSDKEVLEQVRGRLPRMENVKFEAMDMSSSMLGGSQTPVDIKIFGKELGRLKEIADQVVARINDVEGLRDVTHTLAEGKPEYQIRINRETSSRLGLATSQVGATVQAATLGKVATRYREGGDEYDVRVRFKEPYRDNIDQVRNIPIVTPSNKVVYLDQVVSIHKAEGPIQITRENQARRVSVTANIAGRDLGGIVRDIKSRLAPFEKSLPAGYFIEYGGAYEQMQETFLILAGVLALATLLIYMVMASQFESFLYPFIIMFTIPMAVIGVVFGLLVAGRPVNLPVLVGLLILMGIAVNNGIVMIDYINQLKKRGFDKKEAILQGAVTRLRPVLLTALTTILGMLPMAVAGGSGSEFSSPMAITVVGGLTATTILTLVIIPILYSMFDRVSFKKPKVRET